MTPPHSLENKHRYILNLYCDANTHRATAEVHDAYRGKVRSVSGPIDAYDPEAFERHKIALFKLLGVNPNVFEGRPNNFSRSTRKGHDIFKLEIYLDSLNQGVA